MFTERILGSLPLVAKSVINQIEQIKPEHILVLIFIQQKGNYSRMFKITTESL